MQRVSNRIPIASPGINPSQHSSVAEIEGEREPVAGNRELIRPSGKKIEATIARVWCEDPRFVLTLGQGGYGLASVRHLDS